MQKISFVAIFLIIGLLLNTSVIANGQYSYDTSTASGSVLQINQSASPTDIQRFVTVQNNNVIEITQDQCINGIEKLPIDVVFSIDSSTSMKDNDLKNMRLNAAVSFVDMLNQTYDKAGMVTWGGGLGANLLLSSDFKSLRQQILSETSYLGATDYKVGLDSAISILDSNPRIGNSSKVIIFLSDGKPSYPYPEPGEPGSPVDKAKEKGYKIFTIGLNIQPKSPEEDRLKEIAQNTGGEYLASPSSEELGRIFHSIFLKLAGVVQDKGMVTLNIAGGGNVSTHSYPIDVIYALDATTSMGESDPTNERIEAAQNFTDKLHPSIDRAGIVAWDQGIDFTIPLTNDLQSIKTSVTNVDSNGDTDINMGLAGAISLLDKESNSSPDNNTPSTKVIIIITDGKGSYLPSGSVGSLVDQARVNGYTIFSIGVGVLPGTLEESDLINMATSTGGNYYFPPNAQNLQAIFDDIYKIIVESNIPRNLDLSVVTQNYIAVNTSSFTIPPDLVENDVNRGHTMIKWHNISKFTGNFDKELSADETFTVSYSFGLSPDIGAINSSLPIIVESLSDITFNDQNGNLDQTFVPQVFVDVETIKCNPKEILPQISITQDENQTKGQFKPVFSTFIVPGSHNRTLGVYEDRNSTIFEPLETIEYYLEFVNFTQKPVKTFSDTTQYTSNFTGYFEMINGTGQVFNYTGLPEIRYQDTLTNKSSYWFQNWRYGLPLDEGNYTMNFKITDNLANESFLLQENITIDEDGVIENNSQISSMENITITGPIKQTIKNEENNSSETTYEFNDDLENYSVYENQTYGVKINYPRNWHLNDTLSIPVTNNFTTMAIFYPTINNTDQKSDSLVNFGVHQLPNNTIYYDYTFDLLNTIKTNSEIKRSNESKIAEKEIFSVEYDTSNKKKVFQTWILYDDKAFHITFVASTEKDYQTYESQINKIIRSIKFDKDAINSDNIEENDFLSKYGIPIVEPTNKSIYKNNSNSKNETQVVKMIEQNFSSYNNSKFFINQLSYPSNWTVNEFWNGVQFAENNNTRGGKYLDIIIIPLNNKSIFNYSTPLSNISNWEIESMKDAYNNFVLENFTTEKLSNGQTVQIIDFTYDEFDMKIGSLEYILKKENAIYKIYFSSEAEKYDILRSLSKTIINTMIIA